MTESHFQKKHTDGLQSAPDKKRRKRGRLPLDPLDKRTKAVTVRLTVEEAEILESARGKLPRAQIIRRIFLGNQPRPIPSINLETHRDLGRALGNLSALAAASRRGGFVPESELLPVLREVRNLLVSGKAQLEAEDDDE